MKDEISIQKFGGFSAFAWWVLSYTVIVIAWGAYVRATGSGAGCGDHWPLCNGEVIPQDPSVARLIEFSHRLTSGLSLVFVGALFFWSTRRFAKNDPIRSACFMSLIFIIGEAMVGAALVLLKLVAGNDSVLRAVVISAHLVNTFLLLFWLARVVYLASGGRSYTSVNPRLKLNLLLCMLGFVITGAAGAIVALGDTLFPSESLAKGFAEDFSPAAHFLIKLRIWHPIIALAVTMYILIQCFALPRLFKGEVSQRLAVLVGGLVTLQLIGGVVNWLLLAPLGMQMFHLILADITWIALCFWYFGLGRSQREYA
jgi:heme A synthase